MSFFCMALESYRYYFICISVISFCSSNGKYTDRLFIGSIESYAGINNNGSAGTSWDGQDCFKIICPFSSNNFFVDICRGQFS